MKKICGVGSDPLVYDPDPDLLQNVTDPHHCILPIITADTVFIWDHSQTCDNLTESFFSSVENNPAQDSC
jgi:hypothetical protein